MLTTETLFIIGAGASCCYELPGGETLRTDAIALGGLDGEATRNAIAAAVNVDEATVRQFVQDLGKSATYSIDEFVESRRDYLDVGRATIARLLAPRIRGAESQLDADGVQGYRQTRDEDWTRLLLSTMSHGTNSHGDFASNPVRFIVFNFDTLLERRIHDQLVARYRMDAAGAQRLVSRLPIVHVHGSLDGCDPTQANDVANLKRAASRIRLIHDGADSVVNAQVREWVDRAQIICFLGFSYHPINMTRLTAGRADAFVKRLLFGSTFGLGAGEQSRVRDLLERAGAWRAMSMTVLGDAGHNCERFLRENTVFR